MHRWSASLLLLLLSSLVVVAPAGAGEDDPLFINLTSDDPHRADMAITFGKNQFERGHPLTIFLNDKAVFIGAKANAATFADHQAKLAALMQQGAVVIVCPMCMKHYQVDAADLIDGAVVGNPERTGAALFAEDARTLSW